MNKLLLVALVLVCTASVASAQVGNLGVFDDVAGVNCVIADNAPGLKTVRIVHVNAACARASQFGAPIPACWTAAGATYLSDSAVFGVSLGSTQGVASVGYGANLASPIYVIGINMFATGTVGTCCRMTVTAGTPSGSGQIEVVDCSNGLVLTGALGGSAYIGNAAANCSCNVTTEETTWGALKGIYTAEDL